MVMMVMVMMAKKKKTWDVRVLAETYLLKTNFCIVVKALALWSKL
jgi:hypothetical protein